MTTTLTDARCLRLIHRFPVRARDVGRPRPARCVCAVSPHPLCFVVTCRCDHGWGGW